ncbi:GNAT family N-acetyltransferase [Salinigranum rubrum]|uniref:GNAT family N-acetyltransferase n=1 Tax=Salinigranum rubrum TaxID=755307 RepID=A0A2I8VF48_9EURY|nr:GNAT family protein [Salinigranum rubrum]AUV80494.1 GNAT family N-acetyltransferase [Salinigranum rubrum]
MNVEPQTLEAEYVRLEPLSREEHLRELQEAAASSIFEWFADDYSTPEAMEGFVEAALDAQEEGESLPFATVHRETGEAIGSTRFCTIRPDNRSVEIGWTWLTPDHQRTPANTEAKYLMLRHAFEEWSCARVEFETAAGNDRSRAALVRIGATLEGVLRKHMLVQGEPTDSAYFSVIDEEWPVVKQSLEDALDRSMP